MFSQRIDRLTSSLVREILAAAQQPGMISFAGGLPATDAMPEPDWASVPNLARQYGTTEGEPELREAIAEEARALGIDCDASQVLIVSGSQQGIDLATKLFVDPGTPVVVESPTYIAALQAFRLFGANCLGVPVSAHGIDPEQLSATIRRDSPKLAYLIPTFQNPSGGCYSAEVRAQTARVLDEYALPVLEDEPYRELAYERVDRTPLCAQLERAPWIYQGSFSKSFMPGIRIGFLIASPELYPHLVRLKQATDLHTNRPGQWLAHQWLTDPDRETYLHRLRATYSAKRDAMHSALTTHFADLADWEIPPGGLFFWLKLRSGQDTRPLLPQMLERGVAFMPGGVFFPAEKPPLGYMRLNFSHATPQQMNEGLGRLAEALA
jgi:DNA-binding transcriptional MocR family regulator